MTLQEFHVAKEIIDRIDKVKEDIKELEQTIDVSTSGRTDTDFKIILKTRHDHIGSAKGKDVTSDRYIDNTYPDIHKATITFLTTLLDIEKDKLKDLELQLKNI